MQVPNTLLDIIQVIKMLVFYLNLVLVFISRNHCSLHWNVCFTQVKKKIVTVILSEKSMQTEDRKIVIHHFT